MRVLYLDQSGDLGGGEISLLDIIVGLGMPGRVVLFSDGLFRERLEYARIQVEVLAGEGIDQVRSRSGLLRSAKVLPGVLKLVFKVRRIAWEHDLLYANSLKAALVAAIVGRMTGKPVIWHLRDMLNSRLFNDTQRRVLIWLARVAVFRVIANSRATAEAYVQMGGRADHVRVVHNGIDAFPYDVVSEEDVRIQRKVLDGLFDGENACPLAAVFGRLAEWKGQHVFLHALACLPNVRGVIVGDALFGNDHEYADSLKRLTSELGLESRVTFLGFRSDIPLLMKAVDIVVHCSISPEPFGRVIVEGMLAGKPVIASAGGGVAEIIDDHRNGLLVAQDSAEGIAASIKLLLADPLLANRLGMAGRETAISRFSVGTLLSGIRNVMRELPERRTSINGRSSVLFVDQSGQLGGGELCLFDIIRHISSNASVLVFEHGPFVRQLEKFGIPVQVSRVGNKIGLVRTNSGIVNAMRVLPSLFSSIAETARRVRQHDIVYANSLKAFVVAGIAGFFARRPVIWHLHDILTASIFGNLQRRMLCLLGNRFATRIIANSRATAQSFGQIGGDTQKISVIYNGIDSQPVDGVTADQVAAIRREIDIHSEGLALVGLFGRLSEWKGQHVLLQALARTPGAMGVIVGAALFGDDEAYERRLHEMVDSLGLHGRVRFLGFRSDIPLLMKAMDVVVHCSTSPEPFGRVIVEAMLAERPVIASRAGGVLEIVENGINGLLVEPGDPVALSAALSELLHAPEMRAGLGRNGRSTALEKFSLCGVAAQVDMLIQEVAAL